MAEKTAYCKLSPVLCSRLCELAETQPFGAKKFIDHFSEVMGSKSAESFFIQLREIGILVEEASIEGSESLLEDGWGEYGWGVAQFLHDRVAHMRGFVQGYPPEEFKKQGQTEARIGQQGEGPEVVRDVSGVALGEPIHLGEAEDALRRGFFEVLGGRRTSKKFKPDATISFEVFSSLMAYAARATKSFDNPNLGVHYRRTSPSGGSRHPIEVYPLAFQVQGIGSACYHYNPLKHQVSPLSTLDREVVYSMFQKQLASKDFPLGFIVSARFPRNAWKYRYPKSYLFTWLDAGHFVSTLVLSAEALGLKCFLTPAIDVEIAMQLTGIDSLHEETPLYFVACGYPFGQKA